MVWQAETEKSFWITEPGTLVTSCFQLEEQADPQSSQGSLSPGGEKGRSSEREERGQNRGYMVLKKRS